MKNRWPQRLLLAYCCGHAGFLLYSIFPPPPAQNPPGHPALDFYRLAIVGRQQWNMFDTIPILHSLDVRLEGRDAKGQIITAGCVLPRFEPYPQPESVRYYNAFYRLLLTSETIAYRDAYLQKLGRLWLAHRESKAGQDWTLVVDQEYTRNLFHIRRGGPMSVLSTHDFDLPYPSEDSR